MVEHDRNGPVGFVGQWLEDLGAELTIAGPDAGASYRRRPVLSMESSFSAAPMGPADNFALITGSNSPVSARLPYVVLAAAVVGAAIGGRTRGTVAPLDPDGNDATPPPKRAA